MNSRVQYAERKTRKGMEMKSYKKKRQTAAEHKWNDGDSRRAKLKMEAFTQEPQKCGLNQKIVPVVLMIYCNYPVVHMTRIKPHGS